MMIINTNTSLIKEQASPAKKQRRSRRVTFNEMAEVCVLESNCSTGEEEVNNSDLYYQRSDYKNFKKQCLAAVKRRIYPRESPKFAKYANADTECRGLERLVDPVATKELCLTAIQAVIQEQSRINANGDKDSDVVLAEVYSSYSRHARRLAKRLAMYDTREARNVYLSEESQPKENREPSKSARWASSEKCLPLQENINLVPPRRLACV